MTVGLLASVLVWWASVSAQRHAVERTFEQHAKLDATKLQAHFADLERPVITAASFIAADRDTTRRSFARFADSIVSRAPVMRWLAWAPMVHDAHRAAFERNARRTRPGFSIYDGDGNGALVPAPERDNYAPVYAVKAVRFAGPPLGLDLEGDDAQRTAAEWARDKGKAVATVLPGGFDPQARGRMVMVIAPVYRGGKTLPTTVAQRRQALAGYVVAAYRLRAVLKYVTAGVAGPGETISFTPPAPVAGFGQALADGVQHNWSALAGPWLPPRTAGEYRVTEPVMLAGRNWNTTFSFRPRRGSLPHSNTPFGWLGVALVTTAALGTITARDERQRLAAQSLASRRTQELFDASNRLHEAAELLQATLDAAPTGIVALDEDTKITLWNRGAERIFGYTASEVLGKSYIDLATPEEGRADACALYARVRAGEAVHGADMQQRRRDGTLLDIQASANGVFDPEGRARGAVLVLQNMTETRRLEEELRQAQKLEAIGQLTGGVAHDLNNLLGTAITSLDLLRELIEGDRQADELGEDALNALLHGADLVRRLLAFTRRQPLQPERVQVNDLVTEASRLLRPLLGDAVEVALDLREGVWPVLTDRTQFQTTLINLATNGRDAMPYGGQLFVSTRNIIIARPADTQREVPPGEYVTVEVRDTGTGMHPALLQRIFEPFFTTKGAGVGTGLGLSTVRAFVKQLGGYITAESEPGVGSCFRLYLRRFDGREAAELSPDEAPDEQPGILPIGKRVLVVEHHPGLRRSVVNQLTKLGYRTRDVATASAALALLGFGEPFDLLFSDVRLPGGMGGTELACVVRARWPQLRIVLVSGSPELFPQGVSALSDVPLLSRPYREQALVQALRTALGDEEPPPAAPSDATKEDA